MDSKEYVSAYAVSKICGYNGTFDDFKNLIMVILILATLLGFTL